MGRIKQIVTEHGIARARGYLNEQNRRTRQQTNDRKLGYIFEVEKREQDERNLQDKGYYCREVCSKEEHNESNWRKRSNRI